MKTFIKRPVRVKAVQLTKEMTAGKGMPDEVWYNNGKFFIQTLEGIMSAEIGAWFILGNHGEHWFIKDNIFKDNYVEV